MDYFFEVWLRGIAKDYLRDLSDVANEEYNTHITLVRPFNILSSEQEVLDDVRDYCDAITPVPFILEGKGYFEQGVQYVPVKSEELEMFDAGLELVLSEHVSFWEKLNDKKILHATVHPSTEMPFVAPIEQYMLRLTGLRNKQIWFSYDFVRRKVLDREQSLDKGLWNQTVANFLEDNDLETSRERFVRRMKE